MSIKAISINIVVYVVISTISTLLVCNYTNDINLLDIFFVARNHRNLSWFDDYILATKEYEDS